MWLTRVVIVVAWVVLYVGTVVTGSGPHAGDAWAPRNGLDPGALSQLHADAVFLLVGLTLAAVLVLHASGAPALVRRAASALLAVELAQGLVGFVQYATDLPVVLVGLPPARRGTRLGRGDLAADQRPRPGSLRGGGVRRRGGRRRRRSRADGRGSDGPGPRGRAVTRPDTRFWWVAGWTKQGECTSNRSSAGSGRASRQR